MSRRILKPDIKPVGLAEFVKQTLAAKGLTTFDVADNSGNRVSQSYVSQVINGRVTSPSMDKLIALADGMGVSREEVIHAERISAERRRSEASAA